MSKIKFKDGRDPKTGISPVFKKSLIAGLVTAAIAVTVPTAIGGNTTNTAARSDSAPVVSRTISSTTVIDNSSADFSVSCALGFVISDGCTVFENVVPKGNANDFAPSLQVSNGISFVADFDKNASDTIDITLTGTNTTVTVDIQGIPGDVLTGGNGADDVPYDISKGATNAADAIHAKFTNSGQILNVETATAGGQHGDEQGNDNAVNNNSNHAVHLTAQSGSSATVNIKAAATGGAGGTHHGNSDYTAASGRAAVFIDNTGSASLTLNAKAAITGGQGGNQLNGGPAGDGGEAIYVGDNTSSKLTAIINIEKSVTGGDHGEIGNAGSGGVGVLTDLDNGSSSLTINVTATGSVQGGMSQIIRQPVAIDHSASTIAMTLDNKGTINGHILGGTKDDVLTSSGTINGFFADTLGGANKVTLTGGSILGIQFEEVSGNDDLTANAGAGNTVYVNKQSYQKLDGYAQSAFMSANNSRTAVHDAETITVQSGTLEITGAISEEGAAKATTTVNTDATLVINEMIGSPSITPSLQGNPSGTINLYNYLGDFSAGAGGAILANTTDNIVTRNGVAFTRAQIDLTNSGTVGLHSDITGDLTAKAGSLTSITIKGFGSMLNSDSADDTNRIVNRVVGGTYTATEGSADTTPVLRTAYYAADKLFTLTAQNVTATSQAFQVYIPTSLQNSILQAAKDNPTKEYRVIIEDGGTPTTTDYTKANPNVAFVSVNEAAVAAPKLGDQSLILFSRAGTNQLSSGGTDNTDAIVLVAALTDPNVTPPDPVGPTPDPKPDNPDCTGPCQVIDNNPDIPTPVDNNDVPTAVTSPAITDAGLATSRTLQGLVSRHTEGALGGLRVADAASSTGVATGGTMMPSEAEKAGRSPYSMWAQVYGTHTQQDPYDGYDGYRSNLGGMLIAGDRSTLLADRSILTFGMALGYNTNHTNNIDSTDGPGSTVADIDGYQVAAYLTRLGEKYFLRGILGYGLNKFETDRIDSGGNEHKADFDGNHYYINLKGTYDLMSKDNWTLVGLAQTTYNHFTYDEYTESNGGFTVNSDDHNVWSAGLGAILKYDIKTSAERIFQPEVHARVLYDILGDRFNAVVSNTNSAGIALEGAEPDRISYNVGAALTMYGVWGVNLTLNYDYTWRQHADEHSVALKARYRF